MYLTQGEREFFIAFIAFALGGICCGALEMWVS
jgi:hypothetical protein